MWNMSSASVSYIFPDLSGCELVHVPDAVFLLMRTTTLTTCDLSFNLLRRIPAKLPNKFTDLKGKFCLSIDKFFSLRNSLSTQMDPVRL